MESEKKLTKQEMFKILTQDFETFTKTLWQQPRLLTISDDSGKTILHWVAFLERKMFVEYLLTNLVVQINAADEKGITPLMVAALRGNKEIVQMLLENGASLKVVKK